MCIPPRGCMEGAGINHGGSLHPASLIPQSVWSVGFGSLFSLSPLPPSVRCHPPPAPSGKGVPGCTWFLASSTTTANHNQPQTTRNQTTTKPQLNQPQPSHNPPTYNQTTTNPQPNQNQITTKPQPNHNQATTNRNQPQPNH